MMMKYINIILIILCVSCSKIKTKNNHKTKINYDLVDFISVKKGLYATDSIYFLSKKEERNIITEWNNSEYKGIYKMIPNYWIHINFKNDSVRTFRLNGNLIKEESDWTYSLSNPNIISTLWKKSEAIPEPPMPPFLVECDSLNNKAEIDYKKGIKVYTIMGLVVATPLEIYYSDFMEKNYNIAIKVNCVPTYKDECYNNAMIEQMEKEYGKDFINKSREKAEQEFNKLKK